VLEGVKRPWLATSDDRIKMRQLKGYKRPYILQVIWELSMKDLKQQKIKILSKIKQGCRTVFIK